VATLIVHTPTFRQIQITTFIHCLSSQRQVLGYISRNLYLSLFITTQTTDTIRAIVETVDPDAAEAMRMNTGLDPTGTTTCNLYACHDYMSCGHWDLDGLPEKNQTKKKIKTDASEKLSNCLGTCLQYTKNCRSDEFNFSYTEWGILVKTVPGCIW
jgi:hypothetical protein